MNLAQRGFTKEAHKIIGLSHSASLLGRSKSDGSLLLPELWDVMGKKKGKRGINRLMAVCITHGSLSIMRAQALIQDHGVDINEKDDRGRNVLHLALGANYYEPWPHDEFTTVNGDLVRFLMKLNPDLAKVKDNDGMYPLFWALRYASYDLMMQILTVYPKALFEMDRIRGTSVLTLTALAGERITKDSTAAAKIVGEALFDHASRNVYVEQECIDAGVPAALVALAKEKTVKKFVAAAKEVANALFAITKSDEGQVACIEARAPAALTALAKERVVLKDRKDAVEIITGALYYLTKSEDGRKACLDAKTPAVLIALAKETFVAENRKAVFYISGAIYNFAFWSLAGRKACLAADAPSVLTALSGEKNLKKKKVARNIDAAIKSME